MAAINLLPLELRPQPRLAWLRHWRVAVPLAALVLLGAVSLVIWWQTGVMGLEQRRLEENLATIAPALERVAEVEAQLDQQRQQLAALTAMGQKGSSWHRRLAAVNTSLPADLTLTQVTLAADGKVTLSGSSSSLVSLGVFMDRLRQQSLFTSVKLVSAKQGEVAGQRLILFEITGMET